MTKTVFISSATEDQKIVGILSRIISEVSSNSVKVWSAPQNTALGQKWQDEILQAIKICDVLMCLVTPISINKKWPFFEFGIAVGLNTHAIPLCIGTLYEDIAPLNIFQGHEIKAQEDLNLFIKYLLEILHIKVNDSNINFNSMLEKEYKSILGEYEKIMKIYRLKSSISYLPIYKYTINTLTPIKDLSVHDDMIFKDLESNFESISEVADAFEKIKEYTESLLPDSISLYVVYKVIDDREEVYYKPAIFSRDDANTLRAIKISEESLIHYVYNYRKSRYFKNTLEEINNHPKEGEKSLYLTRIVYEDHALGLLGLSSTEFDGIDDELRKFADDIAIIISSFFFSYSNRNITNKFNDSLDGIHLMRDELSRCLQLLSDRAMKYLKNKK